MPPLGKFCEVFILNQLLCSFFKKKLNKKKKHIPVHQGAVEGCCIGFTKFCASLLSSSDAEIRDIPAQMLKEVSVLLCILANKWRCWTACLLK